MFCQKVLAISLAALIAIGLSSCGTANGATKPAEEAEEVTESAAEEKDILVDYDNDIVAACSLTLDKFLADYEMSLAPQRWTLSKFDDAGAIVAMTDVTLPNGAVEKALFVLTPTFSGEKMTGATPHFVSVGTTIYGNDGYCDEFFNAIQAAAQAAAE